ncbi:MAG: hypothetical protein AAF721_07825 [Myxococcota bacterium]
MMMIRYLLLSSPLLFSAACSDDGVSPQNGSGSSGGAADGGGTEANADSSGAGPVGTAGTAAVDSTGGSEMSDSETGTGAGTTGAADTGSGSGSGSDSDGGSGSDTAGTTAACMPITEDVSAIGNNCLGQPLSCPEDYTCQDKPGVVAQAECEILCTEDCDCPDTYSCIMMSAKGVMWMQCTAD